MKKVAILSLLFLFAVCGNAFAALAILADDTVSVADGQMVYGGVDDADAVADTKVLLGKMSKGVYFRHNSDTLGFAAATKHMSGSKSYGTASDSTAIYFQDVGVDGTIPSLSDADNVSFGGGGWTNM